MRIETLVKISSAFLISSTCLANAAGNEFPFTFSDRSSVDYKATPYSAKIDCESFALPEGTVGEYSVTLIAENGTVPEHCRINGILPKEIGFQINLPTEWNGRLYMYGNGGYAGEDAAAPREVASLERGLTAGFATVRTDTGHLAAKEPLGTFAKDEDKLVDHGHRAVHVTVGYAKGVISSFYERSPEYSYFDGCSTGGRQGMMAAQRYPGDFDGIASAAPTLEWSSVMIKGLWNRNAKAGVGLTKGKFQTVFDAALAQCDAVDGLEDGLISKPETCDFDVARDVPQCETGADGDDCLTPRQAEAVSLIHAGPQTPNGDDIFVPQLIGSEDSTTISPFMKAVNEGDPDGLALYAESWMKDIAAKDAGYDTQGFDFDKDVATARIADDIFNPPPDLEEFRDRGGKIVTFWGLADNALNSQMGTRYYEQVVDRLGLEETQDFYRFFEVPGVAHCRGGYGPDEIDLMSAVIDWVEADIAPDRLVAKKTKDGDVVYNREYCPYPSETVYSGNGDPENPENFSCIAP